MYFDPSIISSSALSEIENCGNIRPFNSLLIET